MSAFPDRLQLPFHFDPMDLQRDLAALGNAGWIAHFVKQNYTGDWRVLALRGTQSLCRSFFMPEGSLPAVQQPTNCSRQHEPERR